MPINIEDYREGFDFINSLINWQRVPSYFLSNFTLINFAHSLYGKRL